MAAKFCKCGGRFISIDPVKSSPHPNNPKLSLFTQTRLKAGEARWECDNCGKIQIQRLRKSKRDSNEN